MTRIKICGLSRPEDVDFINGARPDWCGFIINFPKSRRNVTPDQVRALRARLAPGITPVGVFVDQPAEAVAALLGDGTIEVAQLHGRDDEDYLAALRTLAPGKTIWKAFQVRSIAQVQSAQASSADCILLDSGQGSGAAFDWSLARDVRRPFLLAGGLTPDNLPRAIQQVRPMGVDLSSGVETEYQKDRNKILAAVAAARQTT